MRTGVVFRAKRHSRVLVPDPPNSFSTLPMAQGTTVHHYLPHALAGGNFGCRDAGLHRRLNISGRNQVSEGEVTRPAGVRTGARTRILATHLDQHRPKLEPGRNNQ